MVYNLHTYNSALYNAGRQEAAAAARSVISAHTGPHIQAVVGSDGGVTFISDFVITEGTLTRPPTSFNFPDLRALISAVHTADLGASLFAFPSKDLPAAIYPVLNQPDLPAVIRVLAQSDLPATIIGALAQLDLPAFLQVANLNLPATISGFPAPNLIGFITAVPPHNLRGIIEVVRPFDVPASIFPVDQIPNLPGFIRITTTGIDNLNAHISLLANEPDLEAFIRPQISGIYNLPAYIVQTTSGILNLMASLSGVLGDNDLQAMIIGGQSINLPAFIRSAVTGTPVNLPATINKTFDQSSDLSAIIDFFAAKSLPATITGFALGEINKDLQAILNSSPPQSDLSALLTGFALGERDKFLSATINTHITADLGAVIRVAETFVTAIFTVSTMASRNLHATIGRPDCKGGSAIAGLAAVAQVQQAKNLGAQIQSFKDASLSAKISSGGRGIFAIDAIDFFYTPRRQRDRRFFVLDTIDFFFTPFRGNNLSAFIFGDLPSTNLGASITVGLPLLKVHPTTTRIQARDLRSGRDPAVQEIRLELEGALTDYFYVNGTDQAFIRDANEQWRLNIRSFTEIATNIFGDFASARICRLGNIASFASLDEAIRSCISAVLGEGSEGNLGATIQSTGGLIDLLGNLQVNNHFLNLSALAARVFPSDLGAAITPM